MSLILQCLLVSGLRFLLLKSLTLPAVGHTAEFWLCITSIHTINQTGVEHYTILLYTATEHLIISCHSRSTENKYYCEWFNLIFPTWPRRRVSFDFMWTLNRNIWPWRSLPQVLQFLTDRLFTQLCGTETLFPLFFLRVPWCLLKSSLLFKLR